MADESPLARYSDLKGRVVFISGGATGIGKDLVTAFAQQGAKTIFADIQVEAGEALAAETGAVFAPCDITNVGATKSVLDQAEAMGGIHVLINNAANDLRIEASKVTEADWDAQVAVNLKHQFFAAQHAGALMATRGCGSIINFGSVAPEMMIQHLAVYSACKSAARGST
ncbi:MAG: SDR family NAD(P)-dependent oxidoreductase [Pseudomonadota bacterium]